MPKFCLLFISLNFCFSISYAQVYNQHFDKRFSSEVKSAEAYQNHIHNIQIQVYKDYMHFLSALTFSKAYDRIELLRQEGILALEKAKEQLYRKEDYDQKFNDRKHTIHRELSVLIDQLGFLYKEDLRLELIMQKNTIDDLDEYKALLLLIERQVVASKACRARFEAAFSSFEQDYDLAPENKNEIESYSPDQQTRYGLDQKINHIERLTLYFLRLYKEVKILETIDSDFRQAAYSFDNKQMLETTRFQMNHSNRIFQEFTAYPKYNNSENELKNNVLRLVKNYQSISQKTYRAIQGFYIQNARVLQQERANKLEYERTKNDKSNFKNKAEHLAYVANTPSQKYTEKYTILLSKYREKIDENLQDIQVSYNELIDQYIKNYKPIEQNF
ncbi:MAG: hypothetical protein ACPGEC_03415 [Flavobacteriales bacterium]